MICVSFRLDLDIFLSNGDLRAETILVTTEYISGTNMLVYQEVGKTAQELTSALLTLDLNTKTSLRNEYFFHKKTYETDKPKNISKSSFLERIRSFKYDETDISQETLLNYKYSDRHGRNNCVGIVVNRYKSRKTNAYIDFADMNEYINFCLPDWLTAFVE